MKIIETNKNLLWYADESLIDYAKWLQKMNWLNKDLKIKIEDKLEYHKKTQPKYNKTIFIAHVGSYLYGTNTESSDIDLVGSFIPTEDYVLGLKRVEQIELTENSKNHQERFDCTLYELRKYLQLLLQNNPNIIETLFVPNSLFIDVSEEYQEIKNHTKYFLDKNEIYNRFMGYAISQKKKMIIKLEHFEELVRIANFLNNLDENFDKMNMTELSFNYKDLFKIENDLVIIGDLKFNKSRTVKKVRQLVNERLNKIGNRKELILKHGYDTKFGMHLIRLLIEGKMLLEEGEIIFPLPQKELLLDIRNGKYNLKEILDMSEHYENGMKQAYQNTKIGKKKYEKINELCVKLLKESII